VDEARAFLESFLNNLMVSIQDRRKTALSEMHQSIDRFSRLRSQYQYSKSMIEELFKKASLSAPATADQSIVALRLLCSEIELFFHLCKERLWPNKDFDEKSHYITMMDLISQLLKSQSLRFGQESATKPTYSSSFGPIVGLWLIAMHATDHDLRMKAIHLMKNHPRREGFWDGPQAGIIAHQAMILEEENAKKELDNSEPDSLFVDGSSSVVPAQPRVEEVGIEYTGLREARITFRTASQIAGGKPGWLRRFAW
jgi:hypothetical protein